MPEVNEAAEATEDQAQTRVYMAGRKVPIIVKGEYTNVLTLVRTAIDGGASMLSFDSAGRRFDGEQVALRVDKIEGLRSQPVPVAAPEYGAGDVAVYDPNEDEIARRFGNVEDALTFGREELHRFSLLAVTDESEDRGVVLYTSDGGFTTEGQTRQRAEQLEADAERLGTEPEFVDEATTTA